MELARRLDRVRPGQSSDGRYDVWVFDVVNRSERCLTCEMYDLRKANSFNATWHPSGEYLIVQVQKFPKRLGIEPATLATPDRAVHSDLYLIRFDRKDFWQLTRAGETGSAVLDPHFSYDGGQVVWTERIGTRQGRYGSWRLRTGVLQLKRGVPRLVKTRGYEPGEPGLRVSHEFTPDDRSILLSGNLEPGAAETGQNLYIFDTESGETRAADPQLASHNDEFARFSPRGDHIAWTTNRDLFPREPPRWYLEPSFCCAISGSWRSDGSSTRLASPSSTRGRAPRTALGEAYVGDFAWSPEGDTIARSCHRPGCRRVSARPFIGCGSTDELPAALKKANDR